MFMEVYFFLISEITFVNAQIFIVLLHRPINVLNENYLHVLLYRFVFSMYL
ncbi:unnamed protein product [Timema podura]|uniref:Uncharacterized protein n=1 Tax=Timema podura TaxID=61482 RepID=A0ABN7P0W4_TIMPD|nr:unnamed protein product [Timema podura]